MNPLQGAAEPDMLMPQLLHLLAGRLRPRVTPKLL